jgi:hypothetical protein
MKPYAVRHRSIGLGWNCAEKGVIQHVTLVTCKQKMDLLETRGKRIEWLPLSAVCIEEYNREFRRVNSELNISLAQKAFRKQDWR